MTIYEVIRRPIDTEKFDRARDKFNQYAFEVEKSATKIEIRQAVTQLFNVKVLAVQTQILRGKNSRQSLHAGRRSNVKRAIVTLKQGDAIALFEEK